MTGHEAPTADPRTFWNEWNARWRAGLGTEWTPDEAARRRHETIVQWVSALKLPAPAILEVGCGAGWLSHDLSALGAVTGVDIADEIVERARTRFPHIRFLAGDFLTVDLPSAHYDVVVGVDVTACVPDQPALVRRMAERLKPGGYLVLATQNRFVFERNETLDPKALAPLRRWVNRRELRALIAPWFDMLRITTVSPVGHRGVLRLVNSYKLEALLTRVISLARLTRIKEQLGFGRSFVLLARRRPGGA